MKKYNKLEIIGFILIVIAFIFLFKLLEFTIQYRGYGSIIAGIGASTWFTGYRQRKKTLEK